MMADNQTATDEVEIEVLYTHGAHSKGVEFDDESEAFELARDLRGFGTDAFDDFDRDPQHALDTAYDTLFEFTVDAELDDVHDAGDLLGELYDRMQGPRRDEQIGYDGSETRSLGVGDVIVVDGQPFIVDRIGFTDMAARYHVEYDDEDGSDDEPELVTDGGRDPVTFDGYSEIDSAYYLITQHARKCRQAGYEDHADEIFELSTFLLDAITFGEKSDGLDRDDYSVTVDGEQLDLLYEAFEYAVEQEAATGPVQPRDVALARRVYNGGSTDPQVTTDDLPTDTAPDSTPVYAHRERSSDPYVSDFVFCSFGYDHVDGLDGAGASATEWVETQVMQQFDGDDEQLDELLPTEAKRVAADDDPARVGTLYFDADGGQVVALEVDADAFDDGGA